MRLPGFCQWNGLIEAAELFQAEQQTADKVCRVRRVSPCDWQGLCVMFGCLAKVVADLKLLADLVVQLRVGRAGCQCCLQQREITFFLVSIEWMLQIAVMSQYDLGTEMQQVRSRMFVYPSLIADSRRKQARNPAVGMGWQAFQHEVAAYTYESHAVWCMTDCFAQRCRIDKPFIRINDEIPGRSREGQCCITGCGKIIVPCKMPDPTTKSACNHDGIVD